MGNTTVQETAFVFTATDSTGKRRYVESTADNLAAARYRLEIQGYTEIEVEKDAFDAKLDRVISTGAFDDMTLHEKQEFQRRCAGLDAGGFLFWQFLKNASPCLLILGAWVYWRASGSTPWSAASLVAYGCALGYVWFILRGQIAMHLFDQLLEARTWHRWKEVSAITRRIQRWQSLTGAIIPPHELLFTEARVLAGHGDLPAALEKVKPLEEDESFDRSLYFGLLMSIYDIVHDVPGRIAAGEKQLALDPKSLTALVDLAYGFALLAGDPIRARAVLAALDPDDIKPVVQPFLDLIWGVIALDEGRPEEAEERIAEAAEGWHSFSGNAQAKGFARVIQGFHATALRRLGRIEEAEAEFAEVGAFVEATDERCVLRRWSES